jgi:glycosyltransferase involved in cell wall biosynthesis
MRSLMIAPTMPALSGNGLAMRMGVCLAALRRLGEVDLIVAPFAGGLDAPPSLSQASLPQALGVETRIVPLAGREDTHFALIARLRDPAERLRAMRQYGRSALAARLSPPVLADVAAAFAGRRYDRVHVGRAYLARAGLAVAGAAALSLDADENDALALLSQAAARRRAGEPLAAALLSAESEALAREMRADLPQFPRLFASSAAEAASLRAFAPGARLCVAPNAARVAGRPRDDGRTLLFVGNLGYWPNVEGLAWLLDRVWPRVVARVAEPPALWLAGGGCPPELARLARRAGARLLGAVDDLGAVYGRATLALAPLRCGGGTRIKIVEAALARVPVVATAFGAAGLGLRAGRDLWLADEAGDFAGAIREALADRGARRRRAASAHLRLIGRHERENAVRALACQFAEG